MVQETKLSLKVSFDAQLSLKVSFDAHRRWSGAATPRRPISTTRWGDLRPRDGERRRRGDGERPMAAKKKLSRGPHYASLSHPRRQRERKISYLLAGEKELDLTFKSASV